MANQTSCLSDEGGAVVDLVVREVDGSPSVDPTLIITVPNGSLTAGPGANEASLDFGSGVELREVVILFSELVAAGVAIHIQTGVYVGAGSPAAVTGDANVVLPATGTAFKGDGRIEVHLNGQDLTKGDGSGNGTAEWVSSTQIKLGLKIKDKGMVMIRAPFPAS